MEKQYANVKISTTGGGQTKARDLDIGQYAIITEPGHGNNGEVVVMGFDVLVSVSNPRNTWSNEATLLVSPLMAGQEITITIK
jgi:hypothetical protein